MLELATKSSDSPMPSETSAYCRPEAYRAFRARLPEIGAPEGLFRAAWAIALHEHPSAELTHGESAIAQLVETVRRRVRSTSTEALLAHLHDVMFDVAGFRGNAENYYDAANSYLPEVLRTKRGLPIALTLVYRTVAYGVGLTVHGVNAPGHFLAEVELGTVGSGRSMYVDPFHGGQLLHRSEVFERIAAATGQPADASAEPLRRATARQWLGRMLRNLQATFATAGRDRDLFAMQELEQLLDV